MRKLLVIIALVFVLSLTLTAKAADEKKFEPKTFKVTIEVVYNSMTLEEAAKKEMIFKEQFKDACTIDIKLNDGNTNFCYYFSTDNDIRANQ